MKREEFTIRSHVDDLEISVITMVPDTGIRGIVQFSHGMAEHKERYLDIMTYLSAAGYVTVIHDHRGHGRSVKSSEDFGFFYDDTGKAIVEDLHQITLGVKNMYSGVPVILFGHSMGSLVVRNYLKKYEADIDKLIVCGSPSRNPLVLAGLILSAIIGKIRGDHFRSGLLYKLSIGGYEKVSKERTGTANGWLCYNEETVEAYEKDELCGFTFTVNGYKNLFNLLKNAYSPAGWNVHKPDLPILFIAGKYDPVIVSEKAWNEAQAFLKKRGYNNIKGILYDDMSHEILNEKQNKIVYADMLKWIME